MATARELLGGSRGHGGAAGRGGGGERGGGDGGDGRDRPRDAGGHLATGEGGGVLLHGFTRFESRCGFRARTGSREWTEHRGILGEHRLWNSPAECR
ncbi:hypothetical protein EU554_08970, partial [Micrococcus luteus]